jgi:hypothetical protein
MNECIYELDKLISIAVHFHSLSSHYYMETMLQMDQENFKNDIIETINRHNTHPININF